jgi:negative regulator of genetic competence, sporulation and motility
MKIEKLTENKIRIILNIEDLETNNIDFDSVLNNTPETQTLILSILNQAEKEVGFYAQDSKILIEAIASFDGHFVFTITKTTPAISEGISFSRKKPQAKRKSFKLDTNAIIYSFRNFDEFCDFCKALHIEFLSHESLKLICKNTALYFYNDAYYLLISGINANYKHLNVFFSVISEFTDRVNNYKNFDAKLVEHGKAIFKKNAISNTINIFFK